MLQGTYPLIGMALNLTQSRKTFKNVKELWGSIVQIFSNKKIKNRYSLIENTIKDKKNQEKGGSKRRNKVKMPSIVIQTSRLGRQSVKLQRGKKNMKTVEKIEDDNLGPWKNDDYLESEFNSSYFNY